MRYAVALSGGVDSTMAAYMLKRSGKDLVGVTIRTAPEKSSFDEDGASCSSSENIRYARSVAKDLDIPFHVVDLSREFETLVREYFFKEYISGRTPNPCVYCNSRIKFGHLFERVKGLGCQKIATGHFAQILKTKEEFIIAEGIDRRYDQSYFLFDIAKPFLSRIEFPLGKKTKRWVKERASELGFKSAGRASSQDICFTALDGGYREYLRKHGSEKLSEGEIVDDSGKVLGRHRGIAYYTVGQRRGIGLGLPEPVYVTEIDKSENIIRVGTREKAMKSLMLVSGVNWFDKALLKAEKKIEVKIRYNSPKKPARVRIAGPSKCEVEFLEAQFAPTPGQAAVFYQENVVVGGGFIERVLA